MGKISKEILEEFACNNGLQRYNSNVTEMARELLELRGQIAKLAEQPPVAWRDPSNIDPGQGCTYDPRWADFWPHIFRQPLFIHAAPLVVKVDDDGNPSGFITWYEEKFVGQVYKGSSHVSDCEEAYRAGVKEAGGIIEDGDN